MVLLLGGVPCPTLAAPAAALFHALSAQRFFLVGGAGHSTQRLRDAAAASGLGAPLEVAGRAEAAILADIAERCWGVPRSAMLLECASTNCGNNATFALEVLRAAGAPLPARLVLVQDPAMQRRSHESFAHAWRGTGVEIVSAAPALPLLAPTPAGGVALADPAHAAAWPLDAFLDLVMGEVPRLRDDERGYGPRGAGFIGHVDIPADVEAAHAALLPRYGVHVRAAKAEYAAPSGGAGGGGGSV